MGRVSDWHKQRARDVPFPASASEDPGVVMTNRLQHFVRDQGLRTEVMAASFRSVDQVAALAGCDHLTIGEVCVLIDTLSPRRRASTTDVARGWYPFVPRVVSPFVIDSASVDHSAESLVRHEKHPIVRHEECTPSSSSSLVVISHVNENAQAVDKEHACIVFPCLCIQCVCMCVVALLILPKKKRNGHCRL